MPKILFITPYPQQEAPSQRFRFEQYISLLPKEWKLAFRPFFNQKAWQALYGGSAITKGLYTLWGFVKRLVLLLSVGKYDRVFIHREATPIGPPWVEWAIAKVWQKRIIYDFDDAIWLEDPHESGTLLAKLKWKRKVKSICRWSWKVSAGNSYLAQFAKTAGAKSVHINPTTVDMLQHHVGQKSQGDQPITIGWTGTHSTLQYLKPIVPTLRKLAAKYAFRFLVISNRPPDFDIPNLDFVPWQEKSEVQDLLKIHLGVMPLTDDPWSLGKCGFKALQYLSLAIPAVVSPVGVNKKIITPGYNGFWADSQEEWYQHLSVLLEDATLRQQLGEAGKETIRKQYSVQSNQENFLSLFE